MFNNDLVGKGKPWGEKKYLPKYKASIYNRYLKMVHRCEDPTDSDYKSYGAVGIKCEFTSLSQYYNTLKKDPLWSKFKANPELYHIDKDIKCGHGSNYNPSTISIQTIQDNDREVAVRCSLGGKSGRDNPNTHKVMVVHTDRVLVFGTVKDCARYYNVSKESIRNWESGRVKIRPDRGILRVEYLN